MFIPEIDEICDECGEPKRCIVIYQDCINEAFEYVQERMGE